MISNEFLSVLKCSLLLWHLAAEQHLALKSTTLRNMAPRPAATARRWKGNPDQDVGQFRSKFSRWIGCLEPLLHHFAPLTCLLRPEIQRKTKQNTINGNKNSIADFAVDMLKNPAWITKSQHISKYQRNHIPQIWCPQLWLLKIHPPVPSSPAASSSSVLAPCARRRATSAPLLALAQPWLRSYGQEHLTFLPPMLFVNH